MENIYQTIQALSPAYTKADQKVANYVLKERQNITNMTMADIAEGAKVSEGSVVRFLNRLELKKLIDLKLALAKSEPNSEKNEGYYHSLVEKEFIETTHSTAELVNHDYIKQAVDLIETAGNLYVFGVSVSGIAAQMAEDGFVRLGRTAQAVIGGHQATIFATTMTDKDVVLVFSLTGNTSDIYEAAAQAKTKGVKIIAITSYVNSQLAKIADILLQTSAKEEIINGGRIAGLISQLYILDSLKYEYGQRNLVQTKHLKEDIAAAILNKKL